MTDHVVVGMIHDDYMNSRFVRALTILQRQRALTIDAIEFVESGGGNLDRGRNLLVQKFLTKHTAEWLLMVDTDSYFGTEEFDRLLVTASDKDIVSGIYFSNERPPRPHMYLWGKDGHAEPILDWEEGEVLEVDGCGAGFLLVRRSVYEKMDHPEGYHGRAGSWFNQDMYGPADQLLNEDSSFFLRAQQHGFRIAVDTGCFIGHIKSRILGWEN